MLAVTYRAPPNLLDGRHDLPNDPLQFEQMAVLVLRDVTSDVLRRSEDVLGVGPRLAVGRRHLLGHGGDVSGAQVQLGGGGGGEGEDGERF